MMKVAQDNSGKVTWHTYLDQYDRPGGENEADDDEELIDKLYKESFERVAKFGEGSTKEIDGTTLMEFFKAIGIPAEEEEVGELMKLAANGKDVIDYNDYMQMLRLFEEN